MTNEFSKQETVAFEELLMGFDDELVLSKMVGVYTTDQKMMERSNDTVWRPVPYIATSFNGPAGTDISALYQDVTELSVPATIGFNKTSAWKMDALELRDALRTERFGKAAKQKLSSDVNVALMNMAANEGTLVVKRTGAAAGFADVAAIDKVMNEQGIGMDERYLCLSSGDYNNMAADLAGRGTLNAPKTLTAYERARIGMVASFDTYKLDYANRIAVAAGVTVTMSAADQYYTPLAAQSTTAGEVNVDNREQTISIAVSSGTVAVGDCFTIAGVYAVHHITKLDTGELKTFRVMELVTGAGGTGTVKISPPIVSGGGASDVELQYKNVTATPANGAALVFLNVAAAPINPFWHKDAMEILPGRLAIPKDSGVTAIDGVTKNGIQLVLSKQWDINVNKNSYRMDCLFGVASLNREMMGIEIFSQT